MHGKQVVVRVLEGLCRLLWGFPPAVIPVIVDRMGPLPALHWFAANMPRFLVSMRVLGPVRIHLACVVVSVRNGCLYCAHAHAYALELIHLRDRDELFPLDARTLDGWIGLDARTVRNRLRAVLEEAGLHAEALWVERIIALTEGVQEPVDAAEARIAHIVQMVRTMNGIANAAEMPLDRGAHDPVNKNVAIKTRHRALREISTV